MKRRFFAVFLFSCLFINSVFAQNSEPKNLYIGKIEIEGTSKRGELLKALKFSEGATIPVTRVASIAFEVFQLGCFEKVAVEMKGPPASTTLFVKVAEGTQHPLHIEKDKEVVNGFRDLLSLRQAQGNAGLPFFQNEVSSEWQNRATRESFFGNYHQAHLLFQDSQYSPLQSRIPEEKEREILDSLEYSTFYENIVRIAQQNQVVFFNEAHHIPRSRALLTEVLPIFRKEGFEWLLAEAINASDTELQKRGYPLLQQSGLYTDEPFFGDLVRQAIKAGFQVSGYDFTQGDDWNTRDQGQARNIVERVLKDNPKAKILVFGGYDHIKEKELSKNCIPMAVFFKKMTGIDPFTIDLVAFYENNSQNVGWARYLVKKWNPKAPVFLSKGGKLFPGLKEYCDAYVLTPSEDYQSGWPTWTLVGGKRKMVPIQWDFASSPILLQVHDETEPDNAVPIIQCEVASYQKNCDLPLPEGKFRVSFWGGDWQQVGVQHIESSPFFAKPPTP